MTDSVTFQVHVQRLDHGVTVTVTDPSGEHASVSAGDLQLALEMALPYLRSVAMPDAFSELLHEAGKQRRRR